MDPPAAVQGDLSGHCFAPVRSRVTRPRRAGAEPAFHPNSTLVLLNLASPTPRHTSAPDVGHPGPMSGGFGQRPRTKFYFWPITT